jgi:hypothetical protein
MMTRITRMLTGPMQRPFAALLLAAALLRPEGAVGAVDVIPPEDGTLLLDRPAISAIVADVDGDGVRELVRLLPREGNEAEVAVDVISMSGDSVTRHGEARLLRVAGVDEQLGGGPPAVDGLLPVRIDDPARLVAWHEGGRERVLVVTIGLQEERPSCCLTVWAVELSGGAVELVRMPGTTGSAVFIRVVDLDGDGTDELVAMRYPDERRTDRAVVAVYLRTSEGFREREVMLDQAGPSPLLALGDSDGRSGEEIGVIGSGGDTGLSAATVLHRLSMDGGGALRVERGELHFPGDVVGIIGPDGPRLVLASGETGSEILHWPAGEDPTIEQVSIRRGAPVAVLGSGSGARLMLLSAEGTMDVLGPELQPLQGVVGVEASAVFRGSAAAPYVGPVPGGIDGAPAYVFRGRMLQPVPEPDPRGLNLLAQTRVATMPGVVPIGMFGADEAWMALAADPSLDATRDGGRLDGPVGPPRGTQLTIAPRDIVLTEEADSGDLAPALQGAITSERQPARPILLSGGDFVMRIVAPPGTRVTSVIDDVALPSELVPDGGTLALNVPAPGDGNARFGYRLLVVTPAGHGYGGLWEVQVLRNAPRLEVSSATLSLAFDVPVIGETAPGARVSVDGVAVDVAADGTFATTVPGGFAPRRVTVVATDPLGNRADATVSVVAVFDYRTLPWIPIVAVLTVVVGGVLYLRAPRPAPAPARRPEDGTLEELD